MTKQATPTIQVIIRKSDGIVWQGQVNSFSSTNEVGHFDILPKHAHFVGSIQKYIIVHIDNKEKKWDINTGIISVVDDLIEVFLGY